MCRCSGIAARAGREETRAIWRPLRVGRRQVPDNRPVGRILKWPTRADCKSAGLRLRRFESFSYHHPKTLRKTSLLPLYYGIRVGVTGSSLPPFSAFGFPSLLFRLDAQKDSRKIARPFCPQSARSGISPFLGRKTPRRGTGERRAGVLVLVCSPRIQRFTRRLKWRALGFLSGSGRLAVLRV